MIQRKIFFRDLKKTRLFCIMSIVTGRNVESRETMLSKLRDLQQQVGVIVNELNPDEEDESEAGRVNTRTLEIQLQKVEDRMLARFQATENYLTNQMEEQSLAIGMMVGIFVMSSLYIFYYLIENMLRIRRCRCPQLEGWEAVVKAANFSLRVEQQQHEAAAALAAHAAPAVAQAVAAQ